MVSYDLMAAQLASVIEACPLPLPTMANLAAILWQSLDRINWAGFYLTKGEELILGPFQGKAACIVIPFGRGVCGTSAASKSVQLVRNVHDFPGHIACDSASNSQIVLPLILDGRVIGVLDIDSPQFARFTEADIEGLQKLCTLLIECCSWQSGLL